MKKADLSVYFMESTVPIHNPFNYAAKTNESGYQAEKVNDNVLYTSFCHGSGKSTQWCYFDFLSRTVSILIDGSNGDRTVLFSEFDKEILELHRQKLIDLGGHPLPLTSATDKIPIPSSLHPGQYP